MGDSLDVVVFANGTVILGPNKGNFDPAETGRRAKACPEACGPIVYSDASADFEFVRLDLHSLQGRVCAVFNLPECEAYESFSVCGIPAELCADDERSLVQIGVLQRARRQEGYEKMQVETVCRIE